MTVTAERLIVLDGDAPARGAAASGVATTRNYFAVLSLLAVAAFVLGVENRFTAAGLFVLAPSVGWLPPLSDQAWSAAFAIHQQDPAFAACGGTDTLAQFKLIYWWEWLRRASLVALAAATLPGLFAACVSPRWRVALPRLLGLAGLAAAWWPVRALVGLADGASATMSSFDVGQYRHAVDVAFASAVIAGLLASALAPPRAARGSHSRRGARAEWIWVALIMLDICFGALFAATNAAASWPTWPGYDGHVLPPLAQLTSYAPWWLNLTFNPYGIQLAHRALSGALWLAAAWELGTVLLRGWPAARPAIRFGLISAQALTGIATLVLGVPAILSIVHQVGAIFLLATPLAFWLAGRAVTRVPRIRLVASRPAAAPGLIRSV
jgi:cytochrome c oxidase assembly protein subunit 15